MYRRRRAGAACCTCRERKVRCDAAWNGTPCTNCKLDGTECAIKARKRRVRASLRATEVSFGCEVPVAAKQLDSDQEQPFFPPSSYGHPVHETSKARDIGLLSHMSEELPTIIARDGTYSLGGADVMYSYYPFVSADGMHQLNHEDLQYLERLGCYRLPSRHLLDEFVNAYFCHVHSHMPLLDEGDFRLAYNSKSSSSPRTTTSIFLLQAMLFAACCSVPLSTIKRLGFGNFHVARATFYRRAKSLFHVDSHRDALHSAQGALLLTHYVSTSDVQVNSFWLSNAIYFVKSATASRRHHGPKDAQLSRCSLIERLWCCCLIRDSILTLGACRPLQIGVGDGPAVSNEDMLHDCSGESTARGSARKRLLARSFSALCDLVALMRPVQGSLLLHHPHTTPREISPIYDQVQKCSNSLDEWFARTQQECCASGCVDRSAVLQNNIMFIYYHSISLALWNRVVYISVTNGCLVHAELSEPRKKVEKAIHGIDVSLGRIAEQEMLSFMPISVVAHITLPLIWHIWNVKLHADNELTRTRQRLAVYLAALNALTERYEGVEKVLHHVRQMVTCKAACILSDSLRLERHHLDESAPRNTRAADVITSLPQFFLRTMIAVQFFFGRGEYPEDHEFPPELTSPTDASGRSQCTCASKETLDLPGLPDVADAAVMGITPLSWGPEAKYEEDISPGEDMNQSPESLATFDDFFKLFHEVEY
ncbi:hypothetical protein RBB50_007985 [Rhinocladiella similis]